jgi:predicted transcriptional regulator
MYSLPQEIEVWYIIPSIRKELARQLTSEYKLSYEKAGRLLGITKAAVSQYLSNKRANNVKISKDVKIEVLKSAEIMVKDPKKAVSEIQRILKYMKDTDFSCEVCKKYNKGVLEYCNAEHNY